MRTSTASYLYVYSCELTANVQVQIDNFESIYRDAENPTRKLGQLFAQAAVYCNGRAVGFPVCTSYKPSEMQCDRRRKTQKWKEWMTLPVRYCDLSRDASIHFSVWELDLDDTSPFPAPEKAVKAVAEGISNAAFPKRLVAQSNLALFSKRGVLKTGFIDLQLEQSSVPNPFSRCSDAWKFSSDSSDPSERLDILLKHASRQKRNLIDSVEWLDPFTNKKIEEIRSKKMFSDRNMFLVLQMATMKYGSDEYDVVYFEDDSMDLRLSASLSVGSACRSSTDPEMGMENLCEAKHSVMTRYARAGGVDRQLKPNKQAKDRLDAIIKLPSSQPLSREQRDLVWKFRYYLQSNRLALNKFLHSVNWDHASEVQQTLTLINDWAPIEAEDALELLSPAFTHPGVRCYAVSRLFHAASPDQVLLFLPQLVQALKYEPQQTTDAALVTQVDPCVISTEVAEVVEMMEDLEIQKTSDDLASFLIKYATGYPKMANYLFWHLRVEEEATKVTDPSFAQMYKRLLDRLTEALDRGSLEAKRHVSSLKAQLQFVDDLKVITAEAKSKSTRRDIRESALRTLLSKAAHMRDLHDLVLPLDPSVRLSGVLPDTASLFSSAMMPVKLTFKTLHPTSDGFHEYTLIFKQGDDLRQDQLVIQMIRLMDTLFKRDQLDLKLTPYAVLATGVDEGFVQFVKARPLRDVIKKYAAYKENAIREAMKEFRPDANGPFGIEADVVDNYVRSLAGYSVVCYVLGIGDRHLDNLLLCENGRLFHVDFGFILGRDPKPLPPPMKLTTEMTQAIGGLQSRQFKDFCVHCDSAFRILRRHANVILNLFSLMLDAGIPDIAIEKDKAVFKVEQRLRLDLSDEAAFKYILDLIQSSMNAKMPFIADLIHDWKQNLSW